ncbi:MULTISPECIES: DUF402 domain-containing protein [Cytobacillus]|uniref:DUF402 domain-containing protein n=1 Tax=Cytobacillus TaxID=2675230 RepID=UPI002041F625|nr:DUF402 domain-containing protein [Cytobacillus firmus]MCM3706831.1 DUF402 domain-containing protein [Cytobacillus firmus]
MKYGDEMIERKIRYGYGSRSVEHHCMLLTAEDHHAVLFHLIEDPFTMIAGQTHITIPKGSYTIAYYWEDRPYNLYFWRDAEGRYLGSYFNIVKNTVFTDGMVSFEDLIIDMLVLPNGGVFILDEDELPEQLESFESGAVQQSLHVLKESLEAVLSQVISESESNYAHEKFVPVLKQFEKRLGESLQESH